MRCENIYQDPMIEHVFKPDELFDLLGDLQEVSLPTGFVQEINRAHSLRDLFDTATTWLRHLLPADRASICLPDGGMMQVWSLRGKSASRLDKSLPAGYGRPGRVIEKRKLILSPHLGTCRQPDSQMLFKSGLTRAVNAPIMFAGQCYGSLNIVSEIFEDIGLREALILQVVANWLGPALAAIYAEENSVAEVMNERAMTRRARSESEMKSSFIANVSHEIRTPLNAILGMAQMLRAEDLPEQHAEKIDVVLYSARSLLTVLNDILDLSKIEAGRLDLKPQRQNPEKIIRQCVDLWRDRASQKNLILDLVFQDAMPGTLIMDAGRVQQCLSNLLSNAIKFSDNGAIDIVVSKDCRGGDALVRVQVCDSGCGISKEDLATIFDAFSQATGDMITGFHGTGLGLSICRSLARLMDGDVVAKSTQGEGSTFTFSFFAKSASHLDQIDADVPEDTARPPASQIRSGTRILLVEDVPTNRMVVRMLLQRFGVIVDEAENGAVALQKLNRSEFDLVLLDMQMPVMDGAETISRIRGDESAYRYVPVIALTASAMVGDRERFLSMGIDGYIPKPIEEVDLIKEIAAVLAQLD